MDEAGAPGVYVIAWFGMWMPKGTPKEVDREVQRRRDGGAGRSGGAQAARRSRPGHPAARAADLRGARHASTRPRSTNGGRSSRTRTSRWSSPCPGNKPIGVQMDLDHPQRAALRPRRRSRSISASRRAASSRSSTASRPTRRSTTRRGCLACRGPDRDPHPSRQVAHHRPLRAAGAAHAQPGEGRHAAEERA